MPFAVFLILIGLVLLTLSADRFVVAAARLATAWGVSAILIGALVIGMGTSAPEFIVSVVSGGRSLDLAIGNIVGSNVANLSLVLGAAALIAPVVSVRRLFRREGMLMVGGMILFAATFADNELSRVDGLILAAAMAGAAWVLIRWSKESPNEVVVDEVGESSIRVSREVVMSIITLGAMLTGANWLADGALRLAAEIGVSEGFIGLTVVAIGTSLPELATAVAASRRGENDLILGNLLGSNIFNSLTVGAGVALIRPSATATSFTVTLVVMVLVALLAGALSLAGDRLARKDGLVLLLAFAGYLAYSGV